METALSCSTAPREKPCGSETWAGFSPPTPRSQWHTRLKSKARRQPEAELRGTTRQYCPFWPWTRTHQGWGQTGYFGAGMWAKGTEVWLVHSANEILWDWKASRWLATAVCLMGFGRNSCRFRYFWSKQEQTQFNEVGFLQFTECQEHLFAKQCFINSYFTI